MLPLAAAPTAANERTCLLPLSHKDHDSPSSEKSPWYDYRLGVSNDDLCLDDKSFQDRACGTDEEEDWDSFDDEPPPFAGKSTLYLWVSALAISLNALSLGYDVGCMNDALGLITAQYKLTLVQGEIIDGTLNIFAALGALFAAKVADGPFGRRGCLACSAGSYFLGVCLSAVATSWMWVVVGRALCGVAVGLSFTSGGLYLTEIAPAHLRGKLGSLYDLGIDIGIVFGSLVGYATMATNTELFGSRWRFMIGGGAALPAFVLIAAPFLPESPRWLLANDHPEEARATLKRLHGSEDHVEQAVLEFEQCSGGLMATWSDFFFELRTDAGSVRKTILLVMTLGILQQATGSESIIYYCHVFLHEAGMKSSAALSLGFVFVGLAKLAGNIPPLLLSDEYGRLPFLRVSSVGVTGALFTLIIVCSSGSVVMAHGVAEVVLMCVFLFFFSLGLGTLLWVVVPELLPFRWRARGLAAVVVLNRLTSATVTLTALSIIKIVQATGFFTLYLGFAVASLMVTFMIIPETAGRSLESLTKSTSQEAMTKKLSQEALIRQSKSKEALIRKN